MAETPSVSLLMAAYATPQGWLRQAVASALAQRCCSFELIVVDDGSPEPVAGLLSGFDDSRLSVIRLEHGGVSEARNAGIRGARGQYIRFVDSDDYFPPDSTATLLKLVNTPPRDAIAVGATRMCREDLTPIFDWPAGCPQRATEACLLMHCTPMHHSMLFPRAVVAAAGPWDPRLGVVHDWDFLLRAMEQAPVIETREVMTWYRQHQGSVSRDAAETWCGSKLVVERYFERHPEERAGPMGRHTAAMLDFLAAELRRPASPWAVGTFWRALARDPSIARTIFARQAVPRIRRLRWRVGRRERDHS